MSMCKNWLMLRLQKIVRNQTPVGRPPASFQLWGRSPVHGSAAFMLCGALQQHSASEIGLRVIVHLACTDQTSPASLAWLILIDVVCHAIGSIVCDPWSNCLFGSAHILHPLTHTHTWHHSVQSFRYLQYRPQLQPSIVFSRPHMNTFIYQKQTIKSNNNMIIIRYKLRITLKV